MRSAKKRRIDASLFDRIEKLQDQILAEGVYLHSAKGEVGAIVNPAILEMVALCKKAGFKLPDLALTPSVQGA